MLEVGGEQPPAIKDAYYIENMPHMLLIGIVQRKFNLLNLLSQIKYHTLFL